MTDKTERLAKMIASLDDLPSPTTEYTRADAAQARIAELEAALTWYAEHVPDCRKTGLEGDVARGKLDRDGGSKARAALEGGG